MAREFLGVLRPLPPPEHSDLIRGGSEDGLHQEPLPLLQRREHQQLKLSLQAERCGDGHLLYTYRQRITEEGGLFYRPALTEMSTGRGGVLICPSYLHRTAVGITESRWADSPNVLSSSLSFPHVLEKRLPPYLWQRHHPHYSTNLHGVLPGTRPGINNALSINKAVVVLGRWERERRPKEARGSPARTATGMRRVD